MKKIKDKIRKLREYLANGSCNCPTGCFECCTKIFFTPEEKKRMDQVLKRNGLSNPPNAKGNDYCEYLNEQGGCSVYEERPIVCRAFGVVDTPFCFCDKTKTTRSVKESIPLKHYMASKMEFNKGYEYGDEFLEGINNSDPKYILQLIYQSISLYSAGKLSITHLREQYKALNKQYSIKNNKNLHDTFPELQEYLNALK